VPGGGLASADQLCQNEAAQAGLSGSFKALLASSTAGAASRFTVDSRPWVRPDGVTIASPGAALFEADYINSAMYQSADGIDYSNYGLWTGAVDPTTAGTQETTCNNWSDTSEENTAICGRAGFAAQWKFFAMDQSTSCSATHLHLYCLQE
jgi:hypothetical protein